MISDMILQCAFGIKNIIFKQKIKVVHQKKYIIILRHIAIGVKMIMY